MWSCMTEPDFLLKIFLPQKSGKWTKKSFRTRVFWIYWKIWSLIFSEFVLYSLFLMKINCECYKKLASRSWPMLFTLIYFFFLNIHYLVLLQNKNFVVISVFRSKLDHWLLFNFVHCKTILVWGLVSTWTTNSRHCL